MHLLLIWQQRLQSLLGSRLGRTDRGASLVEYALLVALIAIVCIVAVTVLGHNASAHFSTDASMLS